MRLAGVGIAVAFSVLAAPFAAAQNNPPAPKVSDLGEGIHVIFGVGGNIAVSAGPDGVFVFAPDFTYLGKIVIGDKNANLLKKHPLMGRRTEFDDVRELVVHPNYLLSYRVSTQVVEVLQVWHVAQSRYH